MKISRAVAARWFLPVLLLVIGTGCPIFYGMAIEEDWSEGPVVTVQPGLDPARIQHIAVVNPFPKQWEGQWLYVGGEAERFAHILWKELPDRHVYRVDLPVGVHPEQIEEALAAHDRTAVRALLGVDYPIDALVVGRVIDRDFENAFLQGYQTTRDGTAIAYDLDGRELWRATATTEAKVTHVTWKLASLLAESFPGR